MRQRKHKETKRPYGVHAPFLPLAGCIYQSRDPEGCTYQSLDPEECTYQSLDPEECTYQSSDPEGCTYQSRDPEGYTYQLRNLERHRACKPSHLRTASFRLSATTTEGDARRKRRDGLKRTRLDAEESTTCSTKGRNTRVHETERESVSEIGGSRERSGDWFGRLAGG
ncbi:NBS-LRR type resistance protein [Cucumis melo var. makuwa]|uniref:NBS-LRR type resistance protein n=1 Tax=Cucumis melo var. makuwa TaxID=1194695 RepID=A0A5D3CJW9_CUCMM|nr:NBS-LRR type resistance protein [Cucumis melo var. makuwa]